MTPREQAAVSWEERAAERSPLVHRSRARSMQQARAMVDAARRLIAQKGGGGFTTQELIKEAGVALQTFYRHFGGKDQLLLAVLEDSIAEGAAAMEEAAHDIENPVERLQFYVTGFLQTLHHDADAAKVITAEHWRLHQLFPQEMAYATKPVTDLLLRDIEKAQAEGLLHSANPERAAWLTTRLVMATYHHYAFSSDDEGAATIDDDVWAYCLRALGGVPG